MKLAACTIAYNEERFIERCVRQFEGVVDTHLVMLSQKPWHGETQEPDKSEEIARQAGAMVVKGVWDSESSQRNAGQALLYSYDWILIADADEFYTREDLNILCDVIESLEIDAYASGRLITYWKDESTRIEPIERGGIVLVKPTVRFSHARGVTCAWDYLPDYITMHHYSYVRTNEEMKKKLSSFEHQHEIVPGWFENVWQAWTPEMTNLHPVHPKNWHKAVPCKSPV